MQEMPKSAAIALLGGTVSEAARRIGVTQSAITQWPDVLPARLQDRVLAALAREHLAHLWPPAAQAEQSAAQK